MDLRVFFKHLIHIIKSMLKYLKSDCKCSMLIIVIITIAINEVPSKVNRYLFESDQSSGICALYEQMICENGGLLEQMKDGYECKCKDNFYGSRCEKKPFLTPAKWFSRMFDSDDVNVLTGTPVMWWSMLPFTLNRQLKTIYEFHQNNFKKLEMFTGINDGSEGYLDRNMTSTRILPPTHPIECTNVFNNYLPPLADVQRVLVRRKTGVFKPDAKRRNIFLETFYQYFALQFFDANFNFEVTASQLYGADELTERKLRSFSDGMLRTEILDGEHYPPSLSFIERATVWISSSNTAVKSLWFNRLMFSSVRHTLPHWAVGHKMSSSNPMLFVMSTLWVREHNRVCTVLQREWPEWTDDQLYKTARNIVIGEMMTIMMNEVINAHAAHSLSLKHKPEIFHGRLENINSFTTPFELLLPTMWPSSLPITFNNAPMDSAFFSDNRQVRDYGFSNTVKFMVNQEIGSLTHGNYGNAMESIAANLLMEVSRENAIQSFNNYRRKLGLNPYKSFYDLTENDEAAEKLAKLYRNVNDVELLTGMLTEKRQQEILPTVQIMTNSLIVNSILTNSLNAIDIWKPETFGGNKGFDIVRTANIETFVCNNLVDKCRDGFKVKLYAN